MNKYFTITYEVVGGKRNDEIMIWANSMTNAIEKFVNTKFTLNGISYNYSEHAIVSIKC
jgi:hypothetical protein